MMYIEKDIDSDKIEKSLKKMDVLKDLDFSIDVNFLEIIEKAEEIKKDKRKVKFELLGFISLCLSILLITSAIAINLNPKLLLYIEIIMYLLMPFILIPISKQIVKEEL